MELLVIIVLVLLLAVLGWLLLAAKKAEQNKIVELSDKEKQFLLDEQKFSQQTHRVDDLQAELEKLGIDHEVLQKQYQQMKVEEASMGTELRQKIEALQLAEERLQKIQIDYDGLRGQYGELQNNLMLTEQDKEKDHQHLQEKIQLLEQSREQLKKEFSHLASDIFDERQKQFKATNKEQISDILKPFGEDLQKFNKRVNDIHDKQTEGNASLKQELQQLKELNKRITDEAANLTKALKGETKTQGNWGEMQVEMILEQSGLRKGESYEREPNFKDDDNNNFRPDFIVNLPEGKHIIIDSKVSLTAYSNFVGEDDEVASQQYLKQHIDSIKKHINELSEKDYPSLNGLESPDFVLMFMPVEPAFNVAFSIDNHLFNEAFQKNIVVVTPTTLLATLKTVANIWSIELQNRNAKKIADEASKIYERLRVFVEKMEKVGAQLNTTSKGYDEAMKTLSEGRGNLVRTVDNFRELGVRVKKELPASVLEGNRLGGDSEDSEEGA